jgi:hypothetical protein
MFGLMRVSTHERLMRECRELYQVLIYAAYDDIVDMLPDYERGKVVRLLREKQNAECKAKRAAK